MVNVTADSGGAAPGGDATGDVASVEGEVARVTFESERTGFRVLKVRVRGRAELDTWVGVFQSTAAGTTVRATGRYVEDPKHGAQLKVESLVTVAPSTLEGIGRYLGSGMVPGVGPAFASRIVETFGMDTLHVLDREPDRLAEVPGLGARRVASVAEAWRKHRALGAVMILLQRHGVSPALALRIYKRFGAQAVERVERSPYRLALDVWGIGFKTADQIARSVGVDVDSPERLQAGLYQALHDVSKKGGHVYATRGELARSAAEMLGLTPGGGPASRLGDLDEATRALAEAGRAKVERLANGEEVVFPVALHAAEVRFAQRMRALIDHEGAGQGTLAGRVGDVVARFQERSGVALAPEQREAVASAARHKVLVVTGGPGVGKTTVVRAMLALFDDAGLRVRLAAPTGRAAKRMTEATGREALTLHRLLEFDPKERGFVRKLGNPVEGSVLVVDETSMLDLELADSLLQATGDGARLVLVGDVDQLPSVGPGAVLRDVITSGEVPTVRLTRIFRQAAGSRIVESAHRIRDGQVPEGETRPDGEFYVLPREGGEEAADLVLDVVTRRIPSRFGLDPKTDVQVLTPMKKGEVGTLALNERLQAALNPNGQVVGRGAATAGAHGRAEEGRTARAARAAPALRVGDKVMQLRNNYDKEVYNGDVGYVSGADPAGGAVVRFDDRQVVYEEDDLDELTLAYATSVHKSQGSEYPAVVVPVLTQHFVMLSRNLLYTAVTRGKRLVVLVASPRAISMALTETRRENRRTYLAERLRSTRT